MNLFKIRKPVYFVFILIAIFNAQPLISSVFEQQQTGFINTLFNEKRYFECIAESERLIFYNIEYDTASFRNFIAMNYYLGGQYKSAVNYIMKYGKNNDTQGLILLAHSYARLSRFDISISILNNAESGNLNTPESEILLSKIYFYLKSFNYEKASGLLAEYSDNKDTDNIYYIKRDIDQHTAAGGKSPTASVIMSSIVPGSGQIYSGKYIDGLVSIAGISAALFGAYYFYEKEKMNLAVTFCFFSGLFYAGNIYGAYNSATSYNNVRNSDFNNYIIDKYNLDYKPSIYPELLRQQ